MARNPKHVKDSVFFEAMRNWLVNIVVDVFLDELKHKNLSNWHDLVFYVTNDHTKAETRMAIITSAQGFDMIVGQIPIDKLPFIGHFAHTLYEQVGESLEQVADSITAYANRHIGNLPPGYTPAVKDAKDLVNSVFQWMRESVASLKDGFISFMEKNPPTNLPKLGAPKAAAQTQYAAFAEKYPEDVSRLMEFMASLPKEAEDDWQRMSPTLPPEFIKSLLDMDTDDAVKAIKAMTPDTQGEKIADAVGGAANATSEALDEISKIIQGRKAERARRREERLRGTNPAYATARLETENVEGAIVVAVETLTPEQRRMMNPDAL